MLWFFYFIMGACMASFSLLAAYRIPLGLNFINSSSRCDKCCSVISPYFNVPIIGFLLLKGRCQTCKLPIATRHFLMEVFFALAFVMIALFSNHIVFMIYSFFLFMVLMMIGIIDYNHKIIPDELTVLCAASGFVFYILNKVFELSHSVNIFEGLLTAGFFFLAMFLISKLYIVLRKREGLGFGDVKFIPVIALHLGFYNSVLCLILACVLAILAWLIAKIKLNYSVSDHVAFGPSLCAAFFVIWILMHQNSSILNVFY